MSDSERNTYLSGLRSHVLFQKHVLLPLEVKRKTLLREITAGGLSDEQLRFTAGALSSCEYLASLFEKAVTRTDKQAVKKGMIR